MHNRMSVMVGGDSDDQTTMMDRVSIQESDTTEFVKIAESTRDSRLSVATGASFATEMDAITSFSRQSEVGESGPAREISE